MITVIAKVTAAPGKEAELRAMFEAQVTQVQHHEPHTLAYAIYTVDDDPSTFYFYEQYQDEAARAAHSTAPYIRADVAHLGDLTAGAELVSLEPVAQVQR